MAGVGEKGRQVKSAMSLETKCRALVRKWQKRTTWLHGAYWCNSAKELIAILPQRRPKKRKRKAAQ